MSKKSFLVRVRENGRRRHWVWLLCALALFIALPLRTLVIISSTTIYNKKYMQPEQFMESMMRLTESTLMPNILMLSLICAGAVLCGLQGYSYLFRRAKVDMYHSQPVTKRARFFSIYWNGAAYFLLTYLVNMGLALGVVGYYHFLSHELLKATMVSVLFQSLAFMAIYNTVILAVMLTGNYLSAALGIGTFLGIEWGIRTIVCLYCNAFFLTFSKSSENAIKSPLLSTATIFLQAVRDIITYKGEYTWVWILEQTGSYMVRASVIGLVTLLLACLAYYFRAEEAAGKALAFAWMEPVVKLVAIIFVSLTAGWIMNSMTSQNLQLTILGMILGALSAHSVLQIIFEVQLKAILDRWWDLLAGGAVVFLIFAGFKWDFLGYDAAVPQKEDVESTAVMFDAQLMDQGYDSVGYYVDHMYLTNYDWIEKLVAADYYHQTGERELFTKDANYNGLTVLYRMKNGKEKYRTYYIDMASQASLMQQILSDEAYKKGVFAILEDDYLEGNEEVSATLETYWDGWLTLAPVDIEYMIEALRRDLDSYDYQTASTAVQIGTLHISAKYGYEYYRNDSYPIYDTYVNAIEQLKRISHYDADLGTSEGFIIRLQIDREEDLADGGQAQYHKEYMDSETIADILGACDDITYGAWWKDMTQYENNVYIYANTVNGTSLSYSLRKDRKLPLPVARALHMLKSE